MSVRLAMFALLHLASAGVFALVPTTPAFADADDFCAKIRNDDRLRPYDAEMRPAFVRTFRRLFPTVRGGQSEAMLRERAVFRCMNGKLVACFKALDLPCAKIERARQNAGADAFCRVNPQAKSVPSSATGGASEFTFRCHDGRAEISGTAWKIDDRGFAKDVWAPMDAD